MSMSENISARQQTLFKSADHTLSAINAQMIRVHLLFGCTLAVLWFLHSRYSRRLLGFYRDSKRILSWELSAEMRRADAKPNTRR